MFYELITLRSLTNELGKALGKSLVAEENETNFLWSLSEQVSKRVLLSNVSIRVMIIYLKDELEELECPGCKG